jgi:hypothetical protein
VANESVTEWALSGAEYNGKNRLFVALSINDSSPIEYYDRDENGIVIKYNLNGEELVRTITNGYESIPEDKKYLLENFQFKDSITAWSDKSYGFIVEFYELIPVAYEQCSEQQKKELDIQKKEFLILNRDKFSVNLEIIDEQCNSTWKVVDTTDW